MDKVLQVKNLSINFRTVNGQVQAVRDVSFDLHRGRTMAIVGESGSGKSVTSRAILGILANNAIVNNGKIYYSGQDLLKISEDDFHKIRGDKIAMIFQDPLSSLNPIMKIGKQLTEAMILKNKANRKASRKLFNSYMEKLVSFMNLAHPENIEKHTQMSKDFNTFEFKHLELENGYNVAVNNANDLVSQIDHLLFEMSKNVYNNFKKTLNDLVKFLPETQNYFFIPDLTNINNHLNVIIENTKGETNFEVVCDALKGIKEELEIGLSKKAPNFFSLAYYLTFINSEIPALSIEEMDKLTRKELDDKFMIEFINHAEDALKVSYAQSVSDLNNALTFLNTLKTTFADQSQDIAEIKAMFKHSYNLVQESIDKLDIYRTSLCYTYRSSVEETVRKFFAADKINYKLQAKFNKQKASYEKLIEKGKTPNWNLIPVVLLNKDQLAESIIESLDVIIDFIKQELEVKEENINFEQKAIDLIDFFKANASNMVNKVTQRSAKTKAIKLMEEVGIPEPYKRYKQYPFEFSGGMRQRIVIAIALAADPEILICDEPTTALDVTIQAQILELINKLKRERNLSIIFITHDMGVVANMADEISVMYAGKIVESGTSEDIFYDPKHPYTWALLSSMPDLETKEKLDSIPGTPPNMIYPPKGDAFAARNKFAMKIDFEEQPPLFKVSDTHYAATWLLHPSAPKVDIPPLLKERIERMKKEAKKNE